MISTDCTVDHALLANTHTQTESQLYIYIYIYIVKCVGPWRHLYFFIIYL